MTIALRSDASGTKGAVQVNGVDQLVLNADGSLQARTSPGALDNGKNLATTEAVNAIGPVVGTMRNGKMSVTAASATGTFTADEVIVETALGGAPIRLAGFNQAVNLATTGAGGMDTGAAPANGFVGLYAIFNPTTLVRALLAANATAANAPEVYSGANMPAGFTASALVSVWPTNALGQLVQGSQIDREISRIAYLVLNSNALFGAFTALSIAGAVPFNAKRIKFLLSTVNTNTNTVQTIDVATDSNGIGQQSIVGNVLISGNGSANNGQIQVGANRQIFYRTTNNGGGTPTFNMNVTGYCI